MKRVVDIEVNYKCNAEKAIAKFSKRFPEIAEEWGELLQWMASEGVEKQSDEMLGDGTYNSEWSWCLWLEQDENYTDITVIVRA